MRGVAGVSILASVEEMGRFKDAESLTQGPPPDTRQRAPPVCLTAEAWLLAASDSGPRSQLQLGSEGTRA